MAVEAQTVTEMIDSGRLRRVFMSYSTGLTHEKGFVNGQRSRV